MEYLLLLVGFALLVKGADYFVDGSSKLAALMRVPPILIGLTVVAFGTSAPEASVSISAAIKENGSIALGNVIGSNIFNASFIVGVAAIIYPLRVERATIRKEIPLTLLASIVLLIIMADRQLQGIEMELLTRSDGLILLSFFAIFLYYIFEVATHSREKTAGESVEITRKETIRSLIYTIGGLAAIVFGGDMVVKNSSEIAISWGMSQTLVGLTIVAVGTSLPELITSVTAAMKKESEIALGNIVGSNIFNILFILGASATISPVNVDRKMFSDAIIMIAGTLVLFEFSRSKKNISKLEGGVLVAAYIIYTIYIIARN